MNDVTFDLGPLEPHLSDPEVTEIMVNGMNGVFIEKKGKLIKTDTEFKSENHILQVIRSIFSMVERNIDPALTPIVDARLSDGTLVTAVFPPVSLTGTTLTLRKFPMKHLTWDQLIGFGSVTPKIVDFLRACVIARRNIIVSGGTASGKTTIFNAMAEFIPDDERIVTVEPIAELRIEHPHLIQLEARPANHERQGAVSVADLIRTARRLRMERLLTSEIRPDGAWEMIQEMNSGHDGSMFMIHANGPLDALERLEMTIAMGGSILPLLQVRQQIASAVSIIVQQMQLPNRSRKIVNITEVTGIRNGVIDLHPIFEYVPDGTEKGGSTRPTGYKPTFFENLEYAGVGLPDNFFEPED